MRFDEWNISSEQVDSGMRIREILEFEFLNAPYPVLRNRVSNVRIPSLNFFTIERAMNTFTFDALLSGTFWSNFSFLFFVGAFQKGSLSFYTTKLRIVLTILRCKACSIFKVLINIALPSAPINAFDNLGLVRSVTEQSNNQFGSSLYIVTNPYISVGREPLECVF